MKDIKKSLLVLALAFVMIFGLAGVAMAGSEYTGSFTIEDAKGDILIENTDYYYTANENAVATLTITSAGTYNISASGETDDVIKITAASGNVILNFVDVVINTTEATIIDASGMSEDSTLTIGGTVSLTTVNDSGSVNGIVGNSAVSIGEKANVTVNVNVESTNNNSGSVNGIYAGNGVLTIGKDAVVTVNVTSDASSVEVYGIDGNNVSIADGATVDVSATTSGNAFGVRANSGYVTIGDVASVTIAVTGGGTVYGVQAYGAVSISGDYVDISGTSTSGVAYGVYGSGVVSISGEDVGISATSSGSDVYDTVYGVKGSGAVSISGDVDISAKTTASGSSSAYGVYAEAGAVSISGDYVDISAETTSGSSGSVYGVYAEAGAVSISGVVDITAYGYSDVYGVNAEGGNVTISGDDTVVGIDATFAGNDNGDAYGINAEKEIIISGTSSVESNFIYSNSAIEVKDTAEVNVTGMGAYGLTVGSEATVDASVYIMIKGEVTISGSLTSQFLFAVNTLTINDGASVDLTGYDYGVTIVALALVDDGFMEGSSGEPSLVLGDNISILTPTGGEFKVVSATLDVDPFYFGSIATGDDGFKQGDWSNMAISISFGYKSTSVSYTYYDIDLSITGEGKIVPTGGDSGVITTVEGGSRMFTITPADGYEIADVIIDGASVGVVESYYFGSISADHTLAVVFVAEDVEIEDVEIDENSLDAMDTEAYYYDAINWAIEAGIIDEADEDLDTIANVSTRSESVYFMWVAYGSPVVDMINPFTDISADDAYYEAVLWAYSMGITAGTTDVTFSPDDVCTRAQIASFIYRAEGEVEVDGDNDFVDVIDGAYYIDAINWAVSEEIVAGMSDTAFEPDTDCVRTQILTFLYRYCG